MDKTMHVTIKNFIQNSLLPLSSSEIKLDDNLFEFGLDSLKLMRLINFLEDEFKVTIPYEKVNPIQFNNINSIVDLLKNIKDGHAE